MPRRDLLTARERVDLFGVPSDPASLLQFYTLTPNDITFIETKRGGSNKIGIAVQLCLLRHPGVQLRHAGVLPVEFISHVAGQLGLGVEHFARYADRKKTLLEHHWHLLGYLGLRAFTASDIRPSIVAAKDAALLGEGGKALVEAIKACLEGSGVAPPGPGRLEELAAAGRARARLHTSRTLAEALSPRQIMEIDNLLVVNPGTGKTPLAWLRAFPSTASPGNLAEMLDRLGYVRRIGIDPSTADLVSERGFRQLVREGAVAPAFLLSDYSVQRRRATLAAAVIDLEIRLSDASIAMFSKLTAGLFTKAHNEHKRKFEATSRTVGRLMGLFSATIGSLKRARETELDPYTLLDQEIGWSKLLGAAPQIDAIIDLANDEPLIRASEKYQTLRRFAPIFLDAFAFEAAGAGAEIIDAVKVLRDLNASGRRDVPADAPLPFPKTWADAICEGGTFDRRLYETGVVAVLRDRLRSGDVWIGRSRAYRRFDEYLVPRAAVREAVDTLPFTTDVDAYLEERSRLLDWRLQKFSRAVTSGSLEGVTLRSGTLSITPVMAGERGAANAVDEAISKLLPRVRITELLSEVAARTGFAEHFSELRSGGTHPNREALLAAILADAANLGIERMANASQGVSYAQLAWTHAWYISEENYARALACLTDAHSALPFARAWGAGDSSSSDGQFFRVGRRGSAGEINARYGSEPGQKIYSFVSDQYAPFYAKLISATAAEAPYVLDGLVHHGTTLEIATHYTDTGGASDQVFALCHLLGLRFVPRLRDLPERRIATFKSARTYPEISTLIGKRIDVKAIRECWDDVLRLAASIDARTVLPSVILDKLGAYQRQNKLDHALREIGRIERALFTLDWLESKSLREACQAGLNKGEARHSLAQAVFAHKQGRMPDRTYESQALKASGLTLVTAAIAYWNTIYVGRAVEQLRREGRSIPDELLHRLSPLGWEHIVLTGDFLWHEALPPTRNAYRPLNAPLRRSKSAA